MQVVWDINHSHLGSAFSVTHWRLEAGRIMSWLQGRAWPAGPRYMYWAKLRRASVAG